MHVSSMESTTVPFENYSGQQISDIQARSELMGKQSNYMTNMILPEIVKSSKNYPLGPDCVITRDSVPDQSILVNMDLYWYISLEKGCVECKVIVDGSGSNRTAVTQDPRVIITRKPRRFEAYCCAVCRQNFVTVVQALLHMKAFHKPKQKILIQDQNVFHDIDKAMEVPPVPLPWYAKRAAEQNPAVGPMGPATVLPASEADHATSTVNPLDTTLTGLNDAETNPVTILLQAVVKEYGKQVHMVLFGKDFSDVKIQFEDRTSVLAHLPDLVSKEIGEKTEFNPSEKLEFQVQRMKSEQPDTESCVVRVNNPALAQRLITSALRQGVAQGSESDLTGQDETIKDGEKLTVKQENSQPLASNDKDEKAADSPQVKLDSRGRPSKTVRFMVGSPDSDEEGSSSASERIGSRDTNSPNTSTAEKDAPVHSESTEPPTSPSVSKKPKEDEGLQGVVSQLISTASKGILTPVDPISPVPTTVVEEASAALHSQYLPKNRSVPILSNLTLPTSSTTILPSAIATSLGLSPGMVRVQSWGGGSDPQKFALSTYTPSTPQSFEHMTRDELRKSFLTVGRSFTYAEKIKMMNKLNDEDALITQEHVKGAGKLLEAEAVAVKQEKKRGRKSSSSTSTSSSLAEKPQPPTVASTSSKISKIESDPGIDMKKAKYLIGSDGKRKRRSKYDVDKFMQTTGLEKARPFSNKNAARSSSEGSVSDEAEASRDPDENPPSLLDVMRTNFPASLARASFFASNAARHIPTSYPSMLSDSEYYGSGEWASAAMQTLRNLQSTVESSSSNNQTAEKPDKSNRKLSTEDESDSRSSSPFVNTSSGASLTGKVATPGPFVPPGTAAKTDVDAIMALAQQITAEQSHIKHLPQHELSKLRPSRKRSLSPLLTEGEKELIRGRATSNANERPGKKLKKEKHTRNSSKSSETSLKKRSPDSTAKSPYVIAEKGDRLEFLEPVTASTIEKQDEITMKFCKNASAGTESRLDGSAETSMDMPQITNSIETLVKVRYVEKVGRCRVCGYSLPLDENDNATTLKSHVMEHSLKELLQAGCNGKQFI